MKFEDILKELNIEYITEGCHHCTSGFIQLDCPFCAKDSHKWHLGYCIEGNYFHCWRCGSHRLIDTFMELTGLPYHKCKKLLDGLDIPKFKKEEITGTLILPKELGKLKPAHIRYLQSRGFNYKEIKHFWRIEGIGIAKRLSWRIFIPIIYQGKIVSWTTRSISKSSDVTRYISAGLKEESLPHKSLLYGEDYTRRGIIIHEGAIDVWKMGPGAVATFGTGFSIEQINKMIQYPKRAVCFDNEREAQQRARKLTYELSVFPGDTYNIVLDTKDIVSSSDKEIRKLRKMFL